MQPDIRARTGALALTSLLIVILSAVDLIECRVTFTPQAVYSRRDGTVPLFAPIPVVVCVDNAPAVTSVDERSVIFTVLDSNGRPSGAASLDPATRTMSSTETCAATTARFSSIGKFSIGAEYSHGYRRYASDASLTLDVRGQPGSRVYLPPGAQAPAMPPSPPSLAKALAQPPSSVVLSASQLTVVQGRSTVIRASIVHPISEPSTLTFQESPGSSSESSWAWLQRTAASPPALASVTFMAPNPANLTADQGTAGTVALFNKFGVFRIEAMYATEDGKPVVTSAPVEITVLPSGLYMGVCPQSTCSYDQDTATLSCGCWWPGISPVIPLSAARQSSATL